MNYIAITLMIVAGLLASTIIVDANLHRRPMSYARMIAGNVIHAILAAAKWARGVWWFAKNKRVADAVHAMRSPMFALTVADYTDVLFCYADNERVGPGPGRWLAHMPIFARGFPGISWTTVELMPPDLGGRFVRIRIANAQPSDVEGDFRELFDGEGLQTQRRAKVFKRNIPGPLKRQLEETGLYEIDLATYTSFMEAF